MGKYIGVASREVGESGGLGSGEGLGEGRRRVWGRVLMVRLFFALLKVECREEDGGEVNLISGRTG